MYFIFCFIFRRPAEGMEIVLCLAFGMAIVVSGFGFQTVAERTTKAKHIQFVSGVYVLTYWLSALLWDLICFSIPCCLLLVSVCGSDTKACFPVSPTGMSYSTNCVLIKCVKKLKLLQFIMPENMRAVRKKPSRRPYKEKCYVAGDFAGSPRVLWKPRCARVLPQSFNWRNWFSLKSLS